MGDIPGDWSGILLSDGYAGYSAWTAVTSGVVLHALCWSHTRRKFEGCVKREPGHAACGLELIGRIYKAGRREGGSGPALCIRPGHDGGPRIALSAVTCGALLFPR